MKDRSFPDHFSGHAAAYRSFRPQYGASVIEALAALAPKTALVWDAGTGNGQLAALLGQHFARVIATDPSAEQIDQAPELPNVDYRVEPAERSTLDSASVDLVTVAQAVHWFDRPRFYDEVRRVGRPGAAIILLAYELLNVSPAVDAAIYRFYREVVGPYWPPERGHLETGYRDLDLPFPPIAMPPIEITHDWSLEQALGYIGTWSARHRYMEDRGSDPLPLFASEFATLWPPGTIHRVRWPLIVKAGRI